MRGINKKYFSYLSFLIIALVGVGYAYSVYRAGLHESSQTVEELTWDEYLVAKDSFVEIMTKQNPKVAMEALRETISKNNKVAHSCHAITHELGHEAYEKYGSFSGAMKYQDELCNSGYTHGVIESAFSETKDILKTMHTICGDSGLQNFATWQCYHGVGHGVMFFTDNELPIALKLCETYKDTFARSSCVNGVFMENFNVDQESHVSKYVDVSNPMSPCVKQSGVYKTDCYVYAPTHYLFVHKGDYKGALKACTTVEGAYRQVCAQGVGSQALKDFVNDHKRVERLCMSGKLSLMRSCVEGMSAMYLNHTASPVQARTLCDELYFFNKKWCRQVIDTQAALLF
jgi:hypothetical protein